MGSEMCIRDRTIDIVVGKLSVFHWELIQKRGKSAIDLDLWQEPNWESSSIGSAFGYPTEHKVANEENIATLCLEVTADIQTGLGLNEASITLFSEFDEPHNYYFSGMSGGPIFLHDENSFIPLGIIYEGRPGSSSDLEDPDSASFISDNHALIKGVTLNPNIFLNWLSDAGFVTK